MTRYEYHNFDLFIDPGPDGRCKARVVQSPGGQSAAVVTFERPFGRAEVARVGGQLHRRRGTSGDSGPSAGLADLGRRLFTAVFADDVGGCFNRSLHVVDRGDDEVRHGLRIRLFLGECPELADLPWEFLYDPVRRRFLCMSDSTPVVRYPALAEAEQPLPVTGALRLLVVIASPEPGPGWATPVLCGPTRALAQGGRCRDIHGDPTLEE